MLVAALTLAACTTAPPSGPRAVAASAGKDKSAAAFRQDDGDCRQVAAQAAGTQAQAQPAEGTPQQRYDASYAQCMSAKGEHVARVYPAIPLATIGFFSPAGPAGVGSGSR